MSVTLTDIKTPEFTYDIFGNEASAKRVVRVDSWTDVDTAVLELAGTAYTAAGNLVVVNPAQYPGKSQLWLSRITVKAMGDTDCIGSLDANGAPTCPNGGMLTLDYKTPNFSEQEIQNPPTGTILTINRSMSLEIVAEENSGLYWGTSPVGLVESDVKITSSIAIGDIRITWHRVTNPPWDAIYAAQGLVNDDTFVGLDAEQVMFVGVQDQRQYQTDGTSMWSLTYQFSVRIPKFNNGSGTTVEGGWNHYPRSKESRGASGAHFQKVYRSSTIADANLLFLKTDFDQLFLQPT